MGAAAAPFSIGTVERRPRMPMLRIAAFHVRIHVLRLVCWAVFRVLTTPAKERT